MATTSDPSVSPKVSLGAEAGNDGNGKVSLSWTSDSFSWLDIYIRFSWTPLERTRLQLVERSPVSGGRNEEFRRKGTAKVHLYCVPWYRWYRWVLGWFSQVSSCFFHIPGLTWSTLAPPKSSRTAGSRMASVVRIFSHWNTTHSHTASMPPSHTFPMLIHFNHFYNMFIHVVTPSCLCWKAESVPPSRWHPPTGTWFPDLMGRDPRKEHGGNHGYGMLWVNRPEKRWPCHALRTSNFFWLPKLSYEIMSGKEGEREAPVSAAIEPQ